MKTSAKILLFLRNMSTAFLFRMEMVIKMIWVFIPTDIFGSSIPFLFDWRNQITELVIQVSLIVLRYYFSYFNLSLCFICFP